MVTLLTGYMIFFFSRVIDVSLGTVRVLMLMRGKKLWAALLGFLEVLVYVVVLKLVIDALSDPLGIIFYALGFATGNIVGLMIEERLALGYITMQVITMKDAMGFSGVLREAGFGVSIFPCQGKTGCHQLLNIIFERKRLKYLQKLVNDWDENAFVTLINSQAIRGGYFSATRSRK